MSENEEFTYLNLRELQTNEELMDGIQKLLPGWIVNIVDDYAPEYNELTVAWQKLCDKVKTTRKKILIVQYLPIENKTPNDQYINIIADILASKGYLIRRQAELIVCKRTGLALLSRKMYEHFKKHNAFMPEQWSDQSV